MTAKTNPFPGIGACYRVRTLRHMLQAIDCMLGISKIPPTQYSPQAVLHIYGVVVNFEDLIGKCTF